MLRATALPSCIASIIRLGDLTSPISYTDGICFFTGSSPASDFPPNVQTANTIHHIARIHRPSSSVAGFLLPNGQAQRRGFSASAACDCPNPAVGVLRSPRKTG